NGMMSMKKYIIYLLILGLVICISGTAFVTNSTNKVTNSTQIKKFAEVPLIEGHNEVYTQAYYDDLKKKGVTDVVVSCGNLADNYEGFIYYYEKFKPLCDKAGLNLWLNSYFIMYTNGSTADPSDPTYLNNMKTNAQKLVKNTAINGIIFDDYIYPYSLHKAENEVKEEDSLMNFAITVRDSMRQGNPNAKLGAHIPPREYGLDIYPYYGTTSGANGINFQKLSKGLDMFCLEAYRLTDKGYEYTLNPDWIKGNMDYLMSRVKGTNVEVIPFILSYKSDYTHEYWSTAYLQKDIKTILSYNVSGYGVFNTGYIDPTFKWI
ncbi:MAG: hypothetical protein ACXVHV_07245, partial [Methanobacterium sp.]